MNNFQGIVLEGSLTVKTIEGTKGKFNVGTLATALGTFAVKDPFLDEYDQGKYDGTFNISYIYPGSFVTTRGNAVVEVRAKIADLSIVSDSASELSESDTAPIQDPDPAEEPQPVSAVPDQVEHKDEELADKESTETSVSPSTEEADSEDKALFLELYPIGNEVKLDPAVGTEVFRKQIARLKLLGYEYKAKNKVWLKA